MSNKKSFVLYIAGIVIVLVFIAILVFTTGSRTKSQPLDTRLSYSEVIERRDSGEAFILYIHRSSCKICAIVSDSLYDFQGHGLPVYSFNLESMMGTPEYDAAKLELNFSYMPCFKYFSDGKELAHLNNPLNDAYFDTEYGPDRDTFRIEMEEKVTAFIEAAADGKDLITEQPQSPVITGVRVEAPSGD